MRNIILCLICFWYSFDANSSNCTILSQNESAIITTKTGTKCVEFRGLNYAKTYFSADTSLQNNAAYDIEIKNASGRRLLKKTQLATGSSTHLKLNTHYNTTIKVYLKPLTHDTSYEFFVVHDENTSTDESVIYIGLNSKYQKSFTDIDRPCPTCEMHSIPIGNPQSFTIQGFSMSNPPKDAAQCTDANRPPNDLPINRKNHVPLNVNKVLLDSKKWANSIRETHSTSAMYAASLAKMVFMHKTNGELDLSHGKDRKYNGSAAYGNFLYGANSRALGIPTEVIMRGAAAYQAISDNRGVWDSGSVSQGVLNFLSNQGDNPGDPEQTMRGILYFDEVFEKNQYDNNSTSCVDLESKGESSGSSAPGGGGGGGGEGGNNGGGSGGGTGIGIGGGGGGSKVCFFQDGYPPYCWRE